MMMIIIIGVIIYLYAPAVEKLVKNLPPLLDPISTPNSPEGTEENRSDASNGKLLIVLIKYAFQV